MSARGVIKSAREVGAPKLLQLSATRLDAVTLNVPAGRCVDLTLALDEGSVGAELRLLDATSDELQAGRGTYTATARACAAEGAAPLALRAELRVSTGGGAALLAQRTLEAAK
jgi:hypothetical protein